MYSKNNSLFRFKLAGQWVVAFVFSVFLHFGLVYYYLFYTPITPIPQLSSMLVVEFSDPPQSIVAEMILPMGEPQKMSSESMPAPLDSSASHEDIPSVEQESPDDVEPEIVVKKQQAVKNVPKKYNDRPSQKKPQLAKHALVESKSKVEKEKQIERQQSATQSNNAATAPNDMQHKIASELDSSAKQMALETHWQALIKARLERSLRYPEQALRKRLKGKTLIRLTLNNNGDVLQAEVAERSERIEFDREAISNAQRNSPLPKPPETLLSHRVVVITVPVNFDYEKYRY